jgi:hypothetical protein
MMKIGMLFLNLLVAAAAAQAAEAGFWQQLTAEERRAAGVNQLNPEQQALLDQLALRYAREGARPTTEYSAQEVRERARQEVRAEVKQEVRAEVKQQVREEVKQEVREEVTREMKAEEKTREVAKAGLPVEDKDAVIRSRVLGKFNGWSGRTVFNLENGQTWVQANNGDRLWLPTQENPEAEIRPAGLGGWKLVLVRGGHWLRVRRVK